MKNEVKHTAHASYRCEYHIDLHRNIRMLLCEVCVHIAV